MMLVSCGSPRSAKRRYASPNLVLGHARFDDRTAFLFCQIGYRGRDFSGSDQIRRIEAFGEPRKSSCRMIPGAILGFRTAAGSAVQAVISRNNLRWLQVPATLVWNNDVDGCDKHGHDSEFVFDAGFPANRSCSRCAKVLPRSSARDDAGNARWNFTRRIDDAARKMPCICIRVAYARCRSLIITGN